MPLASLPPHQVTKGVGQRRGIIDVTLGTESVALPYRAALKLVRVLLYPERFTSTRPDFEVIAGAEPEVRLNGVLCGTGTRRERGALARAIMWTALEVQGEEARRGVRIR